MTKEEAVGWLTRHRSEQLLDGERCGAPEWVALQRETEACLAQACMMEWPEREAMIATARQARPFGLFVEVGCGIGPTTCMVGLANSSLSLVAIDPHEVCSFPQCGDGTAGKVLFETNVFLAGLQNRATLFSMTSEEAAREWFRWIDFLLIDGEHTFDDARMDLARFGGWVNIGGFMAVDDLATASVKDALALYLEQHGDRWTQEWGDPKLEIFKRVA